jgi:sugar-phosphatase
VALTRDEGVEFRVRGLLLDLDGTLVDSTEVVNKHWGLVADELGVPRTQVVGQFHGMTAAETIRRISPSLSDSEVAHLVQGLHAGEEEDGHLVEALPGALALLQELPAEAWAVVTSCPHDLAHARLRGAGLPTPAHLVTADSVGRGKPDPEPYLQGAKALGMAPEECLAIEDAPSGITSAARAGCQVLAVRTTHQDLAVPSVSDLSRVSLARDGTTLVLTATMHQSSSEGESSKV